MYLIFPLGFCCCVHAVHYGRKIHQKWETVIACIQCDNIILLYERITLTLSVVLSIARGTAIE